MSIYDVVGTRGTPADVVARATAAGYSLADVANSQLTGNPDIGFSAGDGSRFSGSYVIQDRNINSGQQTYRAWLDGVLVASQAVAADFDPTPSNRAILGNDGSGYGRVGAGSNGGALTSPSPTSTVYGAGASTSAHLGTTNAGPTVTAVLASIDGSPSALVLLAVIALVAVGGMLLR